MPGAAPPTASAHAPAPDSPYSWWRLLVSLLASTIGGVGLWSSVVVLPVIGSEFNVDRGDSSIPYAATMIGFAIGGLIMGRVVDRFGVALPVAIGGVALCAGYLLSSQADSLWQVVLCQSLLVGMLGSSATFAPMVADISHWFLRRRGIAVAIVASGNYLAGTVWPPIIQYWIDDSTWRDAHIWIGLVCLCTMLPLALLLRRKPAVDQGDAPVAKHRVVSGPPAAPVAIQTLLVLAGLACCVAMSMPQVHIVAYSSDLGFGPVVGAELLAIMLGLGVVSRLASGAIADRIGGVGTLIIGSALQCMALVLYLPFDSVTGLYVVSALFGLAQGGIVPSYALIVREIFPAREAGWRIGLAVTATIVGMAVGGWLSGRIYDWTGSYEMAFINGIGWNLLNLSIALWFLTLRLRTSRSALPA